MALLQGGFNEEEKNVLPIDILVARYEMLARQAAHGHPAVMVWPETAVACAIQAPGLLPRARKLAKDTHAAQLMGALNEAPGGAIQNGVFLVTRQGVEGGYLKMRLVPFGEYIPAWFRAVSPVARKLISMLVDLSPGTEPVTIPLPGGGAAGAAVCYEAVFAAHGRLLARHGAEVFVNVTNDAWYWRTAATWQHALGPVSRAVECGRDLVRCANTGATLSVSPRGEVEGDIPLFAPGVQIVDVRLIGGRTAWVRMGDGPLLFVLACLLLLAIRRRD
jgi:apolipoprotein N-acyltransferase